MSDEKAEAPRFSKGDRAAVVSGRKNLGVRGEVFWIGENKYGPGVRYGLRGDDGETYWVDSTNIGTEEEAPPAPEPPPADAKPPLAKGARVTITSGREGVGESGEVFWVGDSKFGKGMRYGIKSADGATYWADERDVTPIEGEAPSAKSEAKPKTAHASTASRAGGPPVDDAPMPSPDDFADDAPIDDGAPFPDDDVPF